MTGFDKADMYFTEIVQTKNAGSQIYWISSICYICGFIVAPKAAVFSVMRFYVCIKVIVKLPLAKWSISRHDKKFDHNDSYPLHLLRQQMNFLREVLKIAGLSVD